MFSYVKVTCYSQSKEGCREKGPRYFAAAAFQTQLFFVLFGTVCLSPAESPAGGAAKEGQVGKQLQSWSDSTRLLRVSQEFR